MIGLIWLGEIASWNSHLMTILESPVDPRNANALSGVPAERGHQHADPYNNLAGQLNEDPSHGWDLPQKGLLERTNIRGDGESKRTAQEVVPENA